MRGPYMRRIETFFLKVILFGLLWIPLVSDAPGADDTEEAVKIIQATGVRGGLVVHLGCGDGKLTAALGAEDGYLVQGLDEDPKNIEAARKHIYSSGLYGKVAVEQWSGTHLPYIDNLVNLVVVENRGGASMSEVKRILRPGGVACIRKKDKWVKRRKPWPKDIDEWTHFLHDASGNAVSHDDVVGPPRHMQWLSGPQWSRNHHKLASISSVVSARGRLFYIADVATAGSMLVPGRWLLVARDAFNGVLLWSKLMPSWAYERHGFRAGPVQLPRLLVAVEDKVYMPPGMNKAVSAFDAATGDIITTYEQTQSAEEIVVDKGVLLVVKGAPIAEQAAIHPERGNKKSFPNTKSIVAINTNTCEHLWTWREDEFTRLMPLTLGAKDGRVLFQAGNSVICLALKTGKVLWNTASPVPETEATKPAEAKAQKSADKTSGKKRRKARSQKRGRGLGWATATLVMHNDIALWADAGSLKALSAKDGGQLWQCPCKAGFRSPADVLVADGLVWVGPEYNVGRDLRSGDIKRRLLEVGDLRTSGHHHRCYREKATDNYIIGGYRGMEFFDLAGENHSRNNWVRGTCQYGILPCNGLVYAPSHACGCFMEAKLYGFWALSPEAKRDIKAAKKPRLEKGPAYADTSFHHKTFAAQSPDDWPTYRHDPLRSGATPSSIASKLKRGWKAKLGQLGPPVAVKDTVLVSAIDEHRVIALDTDDGSIRWIFIVGGRVDSPPTVYGNLVLFGSADGNVYCVRLTDGKLVWRFRASPQELRTVVSDRVESLWPVHGSVLVLDDVAYVTAGRSSYLDGGIYMYGLEPKTGKVLFQTLVCSTHPKADEGKCGPEEMTKKLTQNATDPKTFQSPDLSDAFSMAGGTTTDVLVSDGSFIYLRTFRFNKECVKQATRARHLFSTSSLLDGNENHRSHWLIGTGDFSRIPVAYSWIANRPGNYHSYVAVPYGLMLVFNERQVVGIRRLNGYTLYSDNHKPFTCEDEQIPDLRAVPENYKPGWNWSRTLRIRPRALVRAGDVLLVAGSTILSQQQNTPQAFADFEGRGEGQLQILSAKNGDSISAFNLQAPPVWDGMAAAKGRLYISRVDGTLECLSGE